jgi:ribosomal protein S1
VIEVKDDKSFTLNQATQGKSMAEARKKLQKGQIVDAVVIKYNKHGALASIEEGVAGLVHVSEFEAEEKLKTALSLGNVLQVQDHPFRTKLTRR